MKAFKMIAVVGMVGAALSFASAQGMRMMGGSGMSQGMVLFSFGQGGVTLRSDVSKELNLTDAQKGKLEDFQQKQMEEMMASFQGGSRPDQAAMQAMMKKRQEDETKALKETLDAKQQARLKELWIQRLGNGAVAVAEIQKELGLSEDQITKVKELQKKQGEANQAIFEKMRNGEIDREELRPLMEKNTKVLNEEYGKVMNDEQRGKLKTMGGAAFKFDEDTNS